MSRRPDQNAIRAFVLESFEGAGAPPADILAQAVAFLAAWSSLDIRQQFALQQRALGKPLELIAREYAATFPGATITPAGISASITAASKQAQAFLAPGLFPTTSAPPTGDASRGISSSANRKSLNRRKPPQPPQAPV